MGKPEISGLRHAPSFSPVWVRHPRVCGALLLLLTGLVVLVGSAVSFRAGEWVALELELLGILLGFQHYLRTALELSPENPVVPQLQRGLRNGWITLGLLTVVLVALLGAA